MTNRPSRNEVLMQVAEVIATRGTCDRNQVGAVIAREGRILSVGYNGAPPGLPHCDDNAHGWAPFVEEAFRREGMKSWHVTDVDRNANELLAENGCRNATHAEANALAFAARHGIPTEEAQLFVTVSPCDNCARLLIAAGVTSVYYKEAYRDDSGLRLLVRALIPSHQA